MSNFQIFIKDALEKYDKNTEMYYNDIFKDAYYEEFILKNSEIDYDEVIFYDKNKNVIMKATDPIQIDIHLAIASELCKNQCIFKYPFTIDKKMVDETEIDENNIKFRILRPKEIQNIDNIIYKYLFIFNITYEKK